MLRNVAAAMNSVLRDRDVAFRYGGEEFAVILGGANVEAGARVGVRIQEAIAQQCNEKDKPPVTVTIGVAASPQDATGWALIDEADRRLYHGKRSGRNRVESEPPPGSAEYTAEPA